MLSAPSFDKGPDYLEELPMFMKEGYVLGFNEMHDFRIQLEVRKNITIKLWQNSHEALDLITNPS